MTRARPARWALAALPLVVAWPAAADVELAGDLGLEVRFFPQEAAHPRQENSTASPSGAVQPELRLESSDGADRLTLRPFARWDLHDDARTHFDVREASYVHLGASWDLLLGVTRVFWGVTESAHLVDIVNQTDSVEDIDLEDKLGQPMLNVNWIHDSGTYGAFVLVGFRERTFPEERYRFGPYRVDTDDAPFERGAGNGYVDCALRWSHALGEWDLGASYFYGTSREPRLVPRVEPSGDVMLEPRYDLIHQLGVDVQWTHDAWLWKLEAIHRWGYERPFFAVVGGFEYTLFQLLDTVWDLGLLAEYQYDGREANPHAPPVASDNDLFLGTRLALNDEDDTSVLAGVLFDVENTSTAGTIEAERRLTDHFKLELEGRFIFRAAEDDPLFFIRRDDSITLRLTYSF